ncbi:hypothetical protein [Embleya sp. NPDC059237]|uniref:hypothetical protein n=1 Tax=Embleya sp. NPDC059237 TaxID=3346784 RepID=UPI0036C2B30D
MHDDGYEEHTGRDLRMVMDRATVELPPLPDLVADAIRDGRRRRVRSRAVLSAVVVGAVAAVAAPTLLLGPLAGKDTARAGASRSGGELPLAPANWPTGQPLAVPTKAYPTVHVEQTGESGPRPRLTREETELRYAFKQKAADVLTRLLPPDVGEMRIPDNGAQSYRLVSGDKTYDITFRVDVSGGGPASIAPTPAGGADAGGAAPPSSVNGTCAETAVLRQSKTTEVSCTDAKLPDGTAISITSRPAARAGTVMSPPVPMAVFSYRGADVMLALFADVKTNTAPAVGNEQLAKVVTDPTFLELVDFWRDNRIGR